MRPGRRTSGYSLFELTIVCALVALLALTALIPQYQAYAHARQVGDAAARLAQDIAYLERFAQNSEPFEGATIEIESDDPLRYTCFSGRPTSLDPQSHIRSALFTRSFDDVALTAGPLRHTNPFLFAHNGSIQYIAAQQWADQHQQVTIELRSLVEHSRTATIQVNPFTGAVSLP